MATLPGDRRSRPKASDCLRCNFRRRRHLFAWRTWFYSGVFSLLYGTSLKNNDTGLRVSTVGSLIVWKRIAHSLSASCG